MYTYESFETLGAFSLLRPTFITFIIISLILFVLVIVPRSGKRIINGFSVISLSIISIVVSAQLMFYIGIIVDEIGLGGDAVSFYMFFVIAGLGIIYPIIYFSRKKEKNNESH